MQLSGIIAMDLDVLDELLIKYFEFVIYRLQESLNLVGQKIFYCILTEFGIPMKLFRLFNMCLKKPIVKFVDL